MSFTAQLATHTLKIMIVSSWKKQYVFVVCASVAKSGSLHHHCKSVGMLHVTAMYDMVKTDIVS